MKRPITSIGFLTQEYLPDSGWLLNLKVYVPGKSPGYSPFLFREDTIAIAVEFLKESTPILSRFGALLSTALNR